MKRRILAMTLALICTGAIGFAQEETEKKARPTGTGTFTSLTMQMAPLPYHPFPNLPTYATGENIFIYDDREIDYKALREESAKQAASAAGEKDSGGSPAGPMLENQSSSNALKLSGPVFQDGLLLLTIEGNDADGIYDLYWHSSLGGPTTWTHVYRTQPGQTTITLLPSQSSASFFVLGTQLDSDGDGLPDAYELLVLHTDPGQVDTMATLAAAGADPSLLQDVPSEWRVSQILLNRTQIDTWEPCTNITPQFLTDSQFWKAGVGGTNDHIYGFVSCVSGTNFVQVRTIWDTNGACAERTRFYPNDWDEPEPCTVQLQYDPLVKFGWQLEAFPQAGFRRVLNNSGEKRVDLLTGGKRLSTQGWPWLTRASATEMISGVDYPYAFKSTNIPYSAISVMGTPLDSSGFCVLYLNDRTTNDITPTVTGDVTNYGFTVSSYRVKLALNFNTGILTEREHTNEQGQVVGYQADQYDFVTNKLRGPYLGTQSYMPTPTNNFFGNGMDVSCIVPTNAIFDGTWDWRQDIRVTYFSWVPDEPLLIDTNLSSNANFPSFSPGTVGQTVGNDSDGDAEDVIPDANRMIVNADGPGFAPGNVPVGSIYAGRFYARTWLTWNGITVTDVLRWRSFITIKRTSDGGWERAGLNFIGLTPAGDPEVPSFTLNEVSEINGQ